jgi:hypothetical protein
LQALSSFAGTFFSGSFERDHGTQTANRFRVGRYFNKNKVLNEAPPNWPNVSRRNKG